jgi:hypothetical protein
MEHVLIRRLEHLGGATSSLALGFGVEIRERPGPLHKHGAFQDDVVWVQLHGGLYVAGAVVSICWIGEYSNIADVRSRTRGSALHAVDEFWKGRPRYGYAAVATLQRESWVQPFWAGPRTYGYEWVVLEDHRKRASWLEPKPPPRGGEGLLRQFRAWRKESGGSAG